MKWLHLLNHFCQNCQLDFFSLIFGLLWLQIYSSCILFSWVSVELSKIVTEARCVILEIANVWKIVIFPSRVKFLILQIFKTVYVFCIWFLEFFPFASYFVVRIMNGENFQCAFFKVNIFHSTKCYLYPFLYINTCYFTLFLFGFGTEKKENSRILKASITEFLFLKKNLLSSAHAVYKKLRP